MKQQAQEARERARDMRARSHQAAEQTRHLVTQSEEIFHHLQAQQEYAAEHADHLRRPPFLSSPTPPPPPLPHKEVTILLIEDNPADVRLFREALKEIPIRSQVTVLKNSREIAAFVAQGGSAAAAPRPQLILLDYCLPNLEAAATLALFRSLPGYDQIPVVLLSGLPESEGHQRSAALGTTAFVQQPLKLQPYFDAVMAIVYRWGSQQTQAFEREERE